MCESSFKYDSKKEKSDITFMSLNIVSENASNGVAVGFIIEQLNDSLCGLAANLCCQSDRHDRCCCSVEWLTPVSSYCEAAFVTLVPSAANLSFLTT